MATWSRKLGQPVCLTIWAPPQLLLRWMLGPPGLTPAPFFFSFWELTWAEVLAGTRDHLIWK